MHARTIAASAALSLAAFAPLANAQLLSSWSAPPVDDGSTIPNFIGSWLTDVTTGDFLELTDPTAASAMAASNELRRVYTSAGRSLSTFEVDESGALTKLGGSPQIRDINGNGAEPNQVAAMGFANGVLYASLGRKLGDEQRNRGIPQGLYAIDPDTAVATLLRPQADFPALRGFDFNTEDGLMYGVIGGNPQEIVAFDLDAFAVTTIAQVPQAAYNGVNATFDGVAVGDGNVYLTTGLNSAYGDVPIAVFDIAAGTFQNGLPNPTRSAENRFYPSGATFIPSFTSDDADFSDDPNAPSALALALGSNTVAGDVANSNAPDGDRDFLTFTIPAGASLVDITLELWDPNNLGFVAVNAGATGFIPSGGTNGEFLAGTLVDTSNESEDVLERFVAQSVTTNALNEARLREGDYTFVVQQTTDLVQDYRFDFVLDETSRRVQVRSVDFPAGIVELFNFGEFDEDLTGWRFCTHDFNQRRVYSAPSGLNGVTIEAGTSLFIHFNNDAPPADPDRINRSSVGNFALPLGADAYALQLFFPANGSVSFGNSALIADHLQWNIGGNGAGQAEERTAQAVAENLWSAVGDFIATDADAARIDLTDLSGDQAGSPAEYTVTAVPAACAGDADRDGDTDLDDFSTLAVQFGATVTPGSGADLDGNGVVDLDDFSVLAVDFGCEA